MRPRWHLVPKIETAALQTAVTIPKYKCPAHSPILSEMTAIPLPFLRQGSNANRVNNFTPFKSEYDILHQRYLHDHLYTWLLRPRSKTLRSLLYYKELSLQCIFIVLGLHSHDTCNCTINHSPITHGNMPTKLHRIHVLHMQARQDAGHCPFGCGQL